MANRPPGQILFRITIPVCIAAGALGLIWPDEMAGAANGINGAAFGALDWFFLLSTTAFLVACGALAFSRYGKIRLGGPEERPEFSTISWLAMLFAAGMGAGLLFWGVAEPMMHYSAPPGTDGGGAAAARRAMVITNLHWGFHAWGIYAAAALILAYFGFRKGTGVLPGAPLRAAFSGRWVGPVAGAADVVAIFAVAFGVAGSMAMGVLQLETGLDVALGWSAGRSMQIGILVVLFAAYMTSAATSLDKGIKILSNLNMSVAVLLLAFVLLAGPTADLMRGFITAVGDYLSALPALSTGTYPFAHQELGGWFHGWTITYLVWWIAWAPFVGIFIARISRGRTIREFVVGVVGMPSLFSILWFAVFGGTGLHEEFVSGGLADVVNDNVTVALFTLFERLPLSAVLSVAALFLIFVFLVTSVDSATYVLGILTSGGSDDPPTRRKLGWGICLAVMGAALTLAGQIDVVRAVTILGALPFTVVLVLQLAALIRALRSDEDEEVA